MSFVRSSKFRHIGGVVPKPDKRYILGTIKVNTSGEGEYIAVGLKHFAVSKTGGGGQVVIHPYSAEGRLPLDVPILNVHSGKVWDMAFNPFIPTMIATASEDLTAKISIFPAEGMTENIKESVGTLSGHAKKVLSVRFNPCAENILATTSFDNTVKVWDISTQAESSHFADHGGLIYGSAWNRNGSQLATTCKDGSVRIWDPRNPDACSKFSSHGSSKSGRPCWADKQNKFIVTGFSKQTVRQIALYDIRNWETPMTRLDLDQSAGVLSPYYDEDTGVLFVAGKGDNSIKYWEIDDNEPNIHYLSSHSSTQPHKSVGFGPKAACDFMNCEIVRAVRILKDSIEKVQLTVPRTQKNVFQEDLFPPCYAGEPSLTADQWLEGQNKDPIVMDIQELAAKSGDVKEFVAKKSYKELETSLAEALKRIKELEAENAALKG